MKIGSTSYLDFLRSPAHLHVQVDTYNWHIITDQGYDNLAWECACLDDARLVKVKQLLMSWRCMPADMKNLVCWPKGSEECWWGKLEAYDYSLKHAALCMTSYLHMSRTSTMTSRQWSYVRTDSVRLRDRNAQRKKGGEEGWTTTRRSVRNVDSSMLDPPLCIQSITVIRSSCIRQSKHWASSIAANDGTSRDMNIFCCLIVV